MRSPALLILGLGLVAACSKEPSASPPTQAAAAPVTSAAPAAPAVSGTGTGTGTGTSTGEVVVGKPAPSFSVKAHDGKEISTAALKGKPIVVYFYPKDETPGCTKEACSFRDSWKDLEKTGVVLVGVSADSVDSHVAFAKHHTLPFHLVSDADGSLAKLFGVPAFARQSFVIGADGNVKKIYRTVDVTKHASEILADLGP